MDNDAARIVCLGTGTAHKTKLKHIAFDCRREWARTLRNRDIMAHIHIDTELNGADLFTKILARGPFEMTRNRIMVEHNVHHDE